MRKLMLLTVAIFATTVVVPTTAQASRGNNVCANGVMTKKAFLSCYHNNASARALYNSLGITAGGIKAAKTVTVCANQGYTSYGRNWTSGSKKVSPDGQVFYKRPLSSVMRGCAKAWSVMTKSKRTVKVLKFCGNPETKPHKKTKKKPVKKTKKPVKKPTAKPPANPGAAVVVCPGNTTPVVVINSGIACQANSSTQTAEQNASVKNDCKGPNTNSNQCQTTIIQNITQTTIQVNANCSKVIITYGDGSQTVTFKDADGNVVTESYCSSTIVNPPIKPPVIPPVPEDHGPQITCVTPAHVYVGGNVYIWCEASDPDGDALSVNIVGNSSGHISGIIPSNVRWDGTSCPASVSCYRATYWATSVGTGAISATVTAKGKIGNFVAYFPVLVDDFGSY